MDVIFRRKDNYSLVLPSFLFIKFTTSVLLLLSHLIKTDESVDESISKIFELSFARFHSIVIGACFYHNISYISYAR